VAPVAAVEHARADVLVTALIADDRVTEYALQISLQPGRDGWLVSAVEGS
jgi:hypothetical protein